MAQLRIVLLGILTMAIPLDADPGTSIRLKYNTGWKTYRISIDFSSSVFDTFHSCLCDKNSTQCCMELNKTYESSEWYIYYYYYYDVTQSNLCGQQHLNTFPTTYFSMYECTFHFASILEPAMIKCSRFTRGEKRQEKVQERSYLINSKADYCTVPCVTVSWDEKQGLKNITSTARGFQESSCVVDQLVTSSEAPRTTKTKSSVPTMITSLLVTEKTKPETWKESETVAPTQTLSKTRETTQEIKHTISLDDKKDSSQSNIFLTSLLVTEKTTPETWKGRETVSPTQTLSKTRETTQEIRHTVSLDDKKDDSQSGVFLIVVYIVAEVILIFTVILSVVIWRRKRRRRGKHQTGTATTSLHDVSEQGTVSQNYSEVRDENLGENTRDNSSGASSAQGADTNTAITKSKQPENKAVGGAYVSTEEIIRSKRATACKENGLKLTSNNGDISETKNVSTTRNSSNDSQSDLTNTATLGITSTASSVYTRLGDHIRIFENPYNDLRSLEKHTTMKQDTENSFAAQESSAKSSQKTSSASSYNHHNEVSSNRTRSVSKFFANSAYEYVDVEDIPTSATNPSVKNATTKLSLNQEKSASESNESDMASGEYEYTNFSEKDTEPIQNVYARLGKPVRKVENPYDG